MRIPTTAQIRSLEAEWIANCGEHWGQVLMEIAGRGAAIRTLRLWQESPGQVVVVCGKGNNGGDGLVVARYLALWGIPVSVRVIHTTKQMVAAATAGAGAKAGSSPRASAGAGAGSSASSSSNSSSSASSGAHSSARSTATSSARSGATSSKSAGEEDAGQGSFDDEIDVQFASQESNVNLRILESLDVDIAALTEEAFLPLDDVHDDLSDSEGQSAGYSEVFSASDPEVDGVFLGASLIVDAIFGTGLDRQVEGFYKRVIKSINRSGKRVISIDVPSGINSDTGQILGAAVRADETVTFGYLKPGLIAHPGTTLKGALSIVDIGLPELPDLHNGEPDINLTTVDIVREILPMRPEDSHKGTFGNLLTIAGSLGMTGAALLAGLSSLKSGAGLCYLAVARSLLPLVPSQELVYKPMPETEAGSLSLAAFETLKHEVDRVQAVILGPGLSTNDETVELVAKLVDHISVPCIVDADGLNALSLKKCGLGEASQMFVLTPHPKELARLLNETVAEVQADRIKAALKAAKKFQCTVLLKGSMSVIASPEGEVYINPTGNAGMATAGSGDVLSGIIGGLLAQKVEPFQAAVAGAYIHGRAGDILAQEIGEAGIIAGDLERAIPLAFESIREGERGGLEADLLDADAG
ncbi:MAG: NAD(P)H-hydrate dehydratase [Cyanobacteria bacterium HKST-UBA02]|nr:NAD(P)H-hydrate dehydratase [Cyanobacteria bacterium HKST-UBA02]